MRCPHPCCDRSATLCCAAAMLGETVEFVGQGVAGQRTFDLAGEAFRCLFVDDEHDLDGSPARRANGRRTLLWLHAPALGEAPVFSTMRRRNLHLGMGAISFKRTGPLRLGFALISAPLRPFFGTPATGQQRRPGPPRRRCSVRRVERP